MVSRHDTHPTLRTHVLAQEPNTQVLNLASTLCPGALLSIQPHEGLVAQKLDAVLERLGECAIVAWVPVQDLDGGDERGVLGGHGGWVEGLADGGADGGAVGMSRVVGQKPAWASPPLTAHLRP